MTPRDTALLGLITAVFSLVFAGFLVRLAGHPVQLSRAQAESGLAICLAGVVVGVLLVLCVSAFQEAQSAWERSLGAVGLAFGCVLLCLLVLGPRAPRPKLLPNEPAPQATQESTGAQQLAVGRGALLLAPGTSR